MDKEKVSVGYILHRCEEVDRLTQILRQTIDRNFPPNESVDNAILNLKLETSLLVASLKPEVRQKKEKVNDV